jgi:hypothetical protein
VPSELMLHAQKQHVQQHGNKTARHGGHTGAMARWRHRPSG